MKKSVSISVLVENKTTKLLGLSPLCISHFAQSPYQMNINFIRRRRMLSHLCRIRVLWFPHKGRAHFHRTNGVCHVYCNFKPGYTCRTTVIFGTLKDGSLLNNNVASNYCFSYRNILKNGVNALSKTSYRLFIKKLKISLACRTNTKKD